MHTRELGLLLTEQLVGVEDLHYGLWEDDLELSPVNVPAAQQRYTDRLLEQLPAPDITPEGVRVLDVGCGTGVIMGQMLDRGYRVDGVIPAPALAERARQRLQQRPGNDTELFECTFEELPDAAHRNQYDVVLFAESFQYIPMEKSLPRLQRLLKPDGRVVICDFFKTEHHGDGGPGDGTFGGGHELAQFYAMLGEHGFALEHDADITAKVSPNLELVNDVLMNRVAPAARSLGRFMRENHRIVSWLVARIFRRKYEKIRRKYFSGHRSKEVFERYKTYHLLVLRRV